MADYKAMCWAYGNCCRRAGSATNALVEITKKLELAQLTTEEMFISCPDNNENSQENDSGSE